MMKKRKLLLKHHLCPGDVACTTSLVRDLHRQYGDTVTIGFDTNQKDIYKHNPYIVPMESTDPRVETVELCYKEGLRGSHNGSYPFHFATYFYKDFEKKTGIRVDCLESKLDLHLSEEQKTTPPISGRYWLVFAGGKTDFTVKWWEVARYQAVVNRLRDFGLRFAQSGATKPGGKAKNIQPRLENVLDLCGWGGISEFLWQIYHAEGVICPITAAMHISAGFNKPCVVIAGGRESWTWEAYTNDGQFPETADPIKVPHIYLHTQGKLSCCQNSGCYKNKIIKINDDKSLCTLPAPNRVGLQPLPTCMDMITVDHVVNSVLSYYEKGFLPPIGLPQEKMLSWYVVNDKIDVAPENVKVCSAFGAQL